MIKELFNKFDRLGKPAKFVLALVLLGGLGVLDYVTGYEIAFSLFYILPVSLVTWAVGRRPGILMSAAAALVWLGADLASGHAYQNPLIPAWNTGIRLSFFVIVTILLSVTRKAMEREKELARVDGLTGALNGRFFYELAGKEIDRLQRYRRPFTLAYLDIDDFKSINDRNGHSVGDETLCAVVDSIKKLTRKTDILARLGGDEFVLLMPETDDASARLVLPKLQRGLIEEMRKRGWQVTFSMGVVTCLAAPPSIDQLVKSADELMYSVKQSGKNAITYALCEG